MFFLETKTIYLLIRSTEQIRCVNVKGNTRVLTKSFFFFPVQSPRLYSTPYQSPVTVTRRQQSLSSPGSVQLWSETAGMNLFFNYQVIERAVLYRTGRGFFLEWLLAFTKSFVSLVSRVVGLFTSLGA